MLRKAKTRLIILLLIGVILVLTGCSARTSANVSNRRIKATWITALKEGVGITVPLGEITKKTIIHFMLDSPEGQMPFMAYEFEGKNFVRADVCPPCRSYNFSLQKDILICDTCGTKFNARNGEGIGGACLNYPKAPVTWEIKGDKLVMHTEDMKTAYLNTLKPGLP